MKFYRTGKLALWALRRNVLRAALTTLGIVIGIAAVIAMMEIGHGSALAIQRTIASMGANNLLVMPGTAASGGVTFGAGSKMTLTPQDADAIEQESPAVGNVAPVVRARTQVVYGNRNWVPLYIYGTTPAFLLVRNWHVFSARNPRQRMVYSPTTHVHDATARIITGGKRWRSASGSGITSMQSSNIGPRWRSVARSPMSALTRGAGSAPASAPPVLHDPIHHLQDVTGGCAALAGRA
jgi:hypothetical protein